MTRECYFTADGTLFCVAKTIWALRCQIPVISGGDGADSESLELRTARCHHLTNFLVGSAPTCGHHLGIVFRLAGTQARQPIPECAKSITLGAP